MITIALQGLLTVEQGLEDPFDHTSYKYNVDDIYLSKEIGEHIEGLKYLAKENNTNTDQLGNNI